MAHIYLARQSGLGSFERHVVLKTILRERASDQRFVTMFLDEAKLAATLNHQNIAQVYEVDQADGAYFMAMEYVHGENARALLETTLRRSWTIPLELAVMIISGAAAGLHHAHERHGKNGQPLNIVHRDVSPANIMVGYDGSVKVLDFGIAKADERATQTIGGTIKGKYGYMSPEQCKGKPIDRRSDIFALGIVLYELTTLRRAFKGRDDFETMKRIVAGDLVLPTTVVQGFPRELEAIILTALANDAAARFQTAQELIEALDAFTVRAKLTGSNTAMGRFMVQLFGTKKEPWIEAPGAISDRTVVTSDGPMVGDDDDEENNETLVLSSQRDVQRALEDLIPSPREASPAAETEVGGRAVTEGMRPSLRRSAERPSLPFAGQGLDRTPPPQLPGPHATPVPPGVPNIASGPLSGSHLVQRVPAIAPGAITVTGSHPAPHLQQAPVTGSHAAPVTGPYGAPVTGSHPAPPVTGAYQVPPAHMAPLYPVPAVPPGHSHMASTMIGPAPVVMNPGPYTGSGL
ncbi:MAG TPA: protein kinase, partial [Kofleriaceae bacterium]|nr:protein kinase [Kofleriaceae bacterium]